MLRSTLFLIAAGAMIISTAQQANAQSMSLAEQQAEAQRLKAVCDQDPAYTTWLGRAQGGSVRATYEAAAALIQCFYNNVDSRYPAGQKQKWLEAIKQNQDRAQQLQ